MQTNLNQINVNYNLLILFGRFLKLKSVNYEVSNYTAFKFNLISGKEVNEFDRLRITQSLLDWVNNFRAKYLYSFPDSFVFDPKSVNFNMESLPDNEIIHTTEMIYLDNVENSQRIIKARAASAIIDQIESMNKGTKRINLDVKYEYEN